MILDDSRFMQKILEDKIKHIDPKIQIEFFSHPLSFIETIKNSLSDSNSRQLIDALIIDYNMPEMNGLEVLEIVRKNSAFDHCKFLLLSASSKFSSVEGFSFDRISFAIKPISDNDLKIFIDSI